MIVFCSTYLQMSVNPGCKHVLGENIERHFTVFAWCEALFLKMVIVAAALTLTLFHQSHIKNAPGI